MKLMLNILVLIMLSPLASQSQIYQRPNNSYGITWNRGRFDSTLFFATYCGVPVGTMGLHSTNQKMAALYYDSCGHRGYVFDPSDSSWTKLGAVQLNDSMLIVGKDTITVRSAFNKASNGVYKNGDTVKLGTGQNRSIDSNIVIRYRSNKHVGAVNNHIEISNIKLDSIAGLYDPYPILSGPFDFQPVGLNITQWYDEAANDTLMNTYGGPLKTLWWQNYDSAGTRYRQPGGATLYIPHTGPYASNRLFLPRDSVNVFTGANGGQGSMFAGDWALGGSWGYNANIYSGSYPNYPLTISNMHLDLQRETSRGRRRKLTGTGIAGYFWDYKDYQGNINGSTIQDSAYHSKLYGIYLAGEREGDYTVDTTTASKAKILSISKNDSVFAVYAAPMRTRSNSVYNGYGYVSAGQNDFNHFAGRLRIGGNLPTWNNGALPYNLQVYGSTKTDTIFNHYQLFDTTGRMEFYTRNNAAYDAGGYARYHLEGVADLDSNANNGSTVPGGLFEFRYFNDYKTPIASYQPLMDSRAYFNMTANRTAGMGDCDACPNHQFYGYSSITMANNTRLLTNSFSIPHTIYLARNELQSTGTAHASGLDLVSYGGVFHLRSASIDSLRSAVQFDDYGASLNTIGRLGMYASFKSDVANLSHTDSVFGFYQKMPGVRNRFYGTMELPFTSTVADTTSYKPVVINAAGKLFKMAGWPGGSSPSAPVKFSQTATVSVIANDVEATLIGTGTGSLTIPAGTMAAGKSYRVTLRGKYSTDGTNPAQMNWRLYLGSTVIGATGNRNFGPSKTDKGYQIIGDITCRSTGTSGTVMVQGMFFTEDGPGAGNITNGFATTTINTTIDQTFNLTVDLTDGSAGNSCYAYILIFEEI